MSAAICRVSTRRCLATLVVWTAASHACLPAQDSPNAIASARIAEASKLFEQGELESAAIRLRAAGVAASQIETASARQNALSKITLLFKKIDPLFAEEQRTRAAVSRILVTEGQYDQKRGWYSIAHELLSLAEQIAPGSAREQLDDLTAAGPSNTSRGGGLHDDWFGSHSNPMGESGWSVTPNAITSPPHDRMSTMIVSELATTGSFTWRSEIRMGSEPAKLALAFGITDELQYHLFEVRHDLGFSELRLYHWDGRQLLELGRQLVTFTRAERAGWIELEIAVTGNQIRASVCGGIETVRCVARVEKLAGRIGMFVSGDSPRREPVAMRMTRMEPQ